MKLDHSALIASLKASTGWREPSSAAILEALGFETANHARGHRVRWPGERYWEARPRLTRDTDDALRLVERVLPGCWWILGKGKAKADEPIFGAQLLFGEEVIGEGEHATELPIAICIALLRVDLAAFLAGGAVQ